MNPRIVLAQFWRDLKGNRLRTGLTLFGLGWGTFCVVALLSFGNGLQRQQMKRTSALGERIILVWGSRTSRAYQGLGRGRYVGLETSDADAIAAEVAGVAAASPEFSLGATVRGPKGNASASLSGVAPSYQVMRNVVPEAGGRFVNELDQQQRRRVAVIGHEIRATLFGDDPAVGKTVEIRGIPFLVVGTLAQKDQDSNYGGPDDRKVFIPAATAVASLGRRRPDNLVVQVASGARGASVMDGVYTVMGRIHHFDSEDRDALITWDVGETVAMVRNVFVGFQLFLGMIGVLTLCIAGIGVANVMNMAVEDRTSQIGIAMALGARRGWVISQVLLETLLVTAVGGGLGVLLATGVVALGPLLPITQDIGAPILSWRIAAVTAGVLGLVGIAAGLGPARRAAWLRPAEALRT